MHISCLGQGEFTEGEIAECAEYARKVFTQQRYSAYAHDPDEIELGEEPSGLVISDNTIGGQTSGQFYDAADEKIHDFRKWLKKQL